MIKHLSISVITLVAAALLSGCGGSDNKKTFPVSSVASSTAASSTPASSTPASSSVASSAANKVLKIALAGSTDGVDGWHQQVNQRLLTGVAAGKSYKFSYKVKASKAITLAIQSNTGDDTVPTYISMPGDSAFNVTTEWQQKTAIFTATVTDPTVDFQLNLAGQGNYDLYFDDISFTDVDGSNEQITHGTMENAVEADFPARTNGQTDGGTATITFEDQTGTFPENKVLKIDVTDGSTVNWHVQLQQVLPVGFSTTKSYTLSYRIKASELKTIPVLVTTGDPDYVSYPTSMTDVPVTSEWQTKVFTIVPTGNDTTVLFQTNLGNNGAYQLWLDDISVTDVGGANEQITNGAVADATGWTLGLNGGSAAGVLTVETDAP